MVKVYKESGGRVGRVQKIVSHVGSSRMEHKNIPSLVYIVYVRDEAMEGKRARVHREDVKGEEVSFERGRDAESLSLGAKRERERKREQQRDVQLPVRGFITEGLRLVRPVSVARQNSSSRARVYPAL